MICRGGARIRRFGAIDVGRDRLRKDVQPVQFVHSAGYFGQSFTKGVVLLVFAAVRKNGVEDALKEAMAGMVCVEDSD